MDFREITYVLAVAEHGTVSKAAEALYMSQPALSRFILELQERLNVRLFERVNKQMLLTYAGRKYVDTANQIMAMQTGLQNELEEIAQSQKGCLRIAITQTHGKYVLPESLVQFKRKYPRFEIVLHEGGVNIMEKYLADGIVDMSLYSLGDGHIQNPNFLYHRMDRQEIVLALWPENPYGKYAERRPGFRYPWLDLQHMEDLTFLMMPTNWRVGGIGNQLLQQAGVQPERITFSTLETALASAAWGAGGCFVSDICVRRYQGERQPTYYSVGTEPQTVDFLVAQRKSMHMTQAHLDYMQIVKNMFDEQ